MIKMLEKNSTGSRKGKAVLLAEAHKAGRLGKITDFDPNVKKFTDGRAAYNKAVDASEIPKCYITGRTCSNDHFMATVSGKQQPVGVSVGRLLISILDGAKDDKAVDSGINGAVAKEKAAK